MQHETWTVLQALPHSQGGFASEQGPANTNNGDGQMQRCPHSRSPQQVPPAGESQAELPSSLCPAPSTPTSPLCRTTCQTGRAAPKEMGHRLSCVSSCLISIAGESERGWSKTPPSTVKGQEVTEGAAAREILTAHPEKILCYQQGQP